MLNRFLISCTTSFEEFSAHASSIAPDTRRFDLIEKNPFRGEIASIRFGDAGDSSALGSMSFSSSIRISGHAADVVRVIAPTTCGSTLTYGSQSRELSGAGRAGLVPAGESFFSSCGGHHWTVHADRTRVAAAMTHFDCDVDIDAILDASFFDPRLHGLSELAARIRQIAGSIDDEPKAIVDLPAFRACHDQMLVLRLAYILSAAVNAERRPVVARNTAALKRAE